MDEYYKIYGNNFSKDELEKLYAEVITLYLSNNFEVGIKDFIYNKFAEFIEGYNFEKRKCEAYYDRNCDTRLRRGRRRHRRGTDRKPFRYRATAGGARETDQDSGSA